jgi:hypothetical protein
MRNRKFERLREFSSEVRKNLQGSGGSRNPIRSRARKIWNPVLFRRKICKFENLNRCLLPQWHRLPAFVPIRSVVTRESHCHLITFERVIHHLSVTHGTNNAAIAERLARIHDYQFDCLRIYLFPPLRRRIASFPPIVINIGLWTVFCLLRVKRIMKVSIFANTAVHIE